MYIKKIISILLCLLLAVFPAVMSGCNNAEAEQQPTEAPTEKPAQAPVVEAPSIDLEKLEQILTEGEDRVEVVRLITDVKIGTKLAAEHLITALTDKDNIPENAITDYNAVIGKYVTKDLSAGSYFFNDSISLAEVDYVPEQTTPDSDEARRLGYLVITDYVDVDAADDLAPAINKVIMDNPHSTIFFPDGIYPISEPICTPADPNKSVSLYLANYAIIKANSDWDSEEAMVRLGGVEPYNSIYINGSNYYMYGGIVDGSGIANGVSIDSGRETSVRFVSIKNTPIGLHIKHGANSGSSDADIDTVNIVGTNGIDSIGLLIEGYDNTISNMRIAKVQIGVKIVGGGNLMRNLHPLQTSGDMKYDYKDSIGFWDLSGSNFMDFCYSDNFAVGFRFGSNCRTVFDSCFCFWYSSNGNKQIGFQSDGQFNAVIVNSRVSLKSDCTDTAYLKVGQSGGCGAIEYPLCNDNNMTDLTYRDYLKSSVIQY